MTTIFIIFYFINHRLCKNLFVTNHGKLCHELKILKIMFLVQLEFAYYNDCHGVAVS